MRGRKWKVEILFFCGMQVAPDVVSELVAEIDGFVYVGFEVEF